MVYEIAMSTNKLLNLSKVYGNKMIKNYVLFYAFLEKFNETKLEPKEVSDVFYRKTMSLVGKNLI